MAAVDFLHHKNPPTWAGVKPATFGAEGQRQINYATQSAKVVNYIFLINPVQSPVLTSSCFSLFTPPREWGPEPVGPCLKMPLEKSGRDEELTRKYSNFQNGFSASIRTMQGNNFGVEARQRYTGLGLRTCLVVQRPGVTVNEFI
ncbi:hypothetical protein TNCV_3723671 [Trichonephila clavipes]|nr:hypothetical protein TNCV_3723671 [Trichonephila clavipes]